MSNNHEPANKSDRDTRKLQRDKNGKDPTATSVEDVTTKEEETEYYEEGNGGATD